MDLIRQNYSDNSMDDSSNSPPCFTYMSNTVGAPKSGPRVGDEYQVEVIPSIMKQSERLQLEKNPAESEVGHDNSISFAIGLPVPVTWILNEAQNSGHEGKGSLGDNGEGLKANTLQSVMTEDSNSDQLGTSKKYTLVPGIPSNSWSDLDAKGFLLGLYVFGKNFIQIKRFLENKGMGEILAFYYGKFYRSNEYHRWSAFRTTKGRKSPMLLTVRRQRALMSRLISRGSEESKRSLRQASKSYTDGKSSLEKYISSLKFAVGLGALVEAAGIGKEKEDLTNLAVEPRKKRVGRTANTWSSLGPDGIIDFLTGEFRLSKTKSNDLFWEAVWPRLLARGWHCEKPVKQGYERSKDYLVFLIPGVKKFSKTKLVKGDQYFDSVSDVLSKVVAEPNLLGPGDEAELNHLGLGEEAEVGSCNDEEPERGSDKDDSHRECYLKPQAATSHTDDTEFTIVDTSLVPGGKASDLREFKPAPVDFVGKVEVDAATDISRKGGKHLRNVRHNKDMSGSIEQKLTGTSMREGKLLKVRELKDLPVEVEDAPKVTGLLRESKGSSRDDSPSVVAATNMLIHDNKNISSISDIHIAKKVVGILKDQKTRVSNDTQPKRTIKSSRSGHSNHPALPVKSRKMTACVNAEKMAPSHKTVGDSVSSQKKAISIPPTRKGGPSLKAKVAEDEQSLKAMVAEHEQSLKAMMAEHEQSLKAMVEEDEQSLKANEAVEDPNGNSKRQSGRNRPLTVKAKESLGNEFWHGPKRQKREHIATHEDAVKARGKGKKMVQSDSSESSE